MQEDRNPLGVQRLLPVFDFFLLLMLMMFGTAGLRQVLAPAALDVNATPGPTLERSGGPVQADPVGAGTDREESARLRNVLENLKNQRAALEQELGSLEPSGGHADDDEEALRRITRENEDLQKHIAALQSEIHGEGRPAIQVESTPLVNLATRRSPVHVALVGGKVAPLREPFYSMTLETAARGGGRFESVVKASRKQAGESVEESLAAGSAFMKLLEEIDARNQYVAFFVDGSSFEAFRSLRDELRKRGIPFGWEPSVASTIYFAATGQIIGEDL